jgi:hypothetical protein
MEKDLINQFNLPPYIKGKTFADASKAIEKKFKDRNDLAAADTKNDLLTRLSKAQEYVKMQESLKANSQEVPDMMNGDIPEGMEEFTQNQARDGDIFNPIAPVGEEAFGPTSQMKGEGIAGMDFTGTAGNVLQAGQLDKHMMYKHIRKED